MAFNHRQYLNQFLTDYQAGRFSNNSPARVARSASLPCYRIIGIHKLTPDENSGKHNVFIDVIDRFGNRLNERIAWGWEGKRATEAAPPIFLDKPTTEPGGNIVIWGGQVIWAEVLLKPTDRIVNCTTGLPDEGPGNTWGHHSYYCVWMWDEAGSTPPPPPIIEPSDCTELQRDYDELRATLQAVKALLERI